MDTHSAAYASLPRFDSEPKRDFSSKKTDADQDLPSSGRGSFIIEIILLVLCVLGHVALVAAFVVLIVVRKRRDGRPIHFDGDDMGEVTGYLYQKLANKPGAVVKVYLVPFLYLTQKLALRRNIRVKHSLTAMDDQANAWLGLGATVPVLWRYKDMFSSEGRKTRRSDLAALGFIFCIVFYLGASLLLGIAASDLFIFANTYGTRGYQNLTSPALMANMSQNAGWIEESFPAVSVLPLLNSISNVAMATTGLVGSAVYDVPNYSTTLKLVNVTALVFQADCQAVPQAEQTGTVDPDDPKYAIHVDDALENFFVALTARTLNVRAANWTDGTSPATVFVASTMPVLDDEQTPAPSVDLNPTIVPNGCRVPSGCANVSSVQILACDLNVTQQSLQLDTSVYPIAVYGQLPQANTSTWRNWTPKEAYTLNGTLPMAWQFAALSHSSQYTQWWDVNNITMQYSPTLLEETLMEILGYYNEDVLKVPLWRLDSLLSQAVALVYWRTAVNLLEMEAEWDPARHNALSRYHVNNLVQIDPVTPWTSLVLSIVMLVTASIVIQQPRPHTKDGRHHKLDGLGVLEMTWLLGRDERDIAGDLAEVREPTLENLRKRGKHLVNPYIGS